MLKRRRVILSVNIMDPALVNGNDNNNKARARWAILRGAILGETTNNNKGNEKAVKMASIHSFPGFCLLERRQVDVDSIIDADVVNKIMMGGDDERKYEILEYKVPIRDKAEEEPIVIRTREKRCCHKQTKVNIKALVSERYYGVDNTSNIKVWDSEGILTFCMMRRRCCNKSNSASPISSSSISLDYFSNILAIPNTNNSKQGGVSEKTKVLRVLELGCGMAGIAGLTMAFLEDNCHELFHDVQVQVVLTDGHPEAVTNNLICASLSAAVATPSQQKQQPATQKNNIMACTLLWKQTQDGANECAQLTLDYTHLFQLLLISDCLHFVNFHAALACTIGRLLDVHGLAILCQPRRGASLDQFLLLVEAMNKNSISIEDASLSSASTAASFEPLFDTTLLHDYDEVLTNLHHQFLIQHEETYRPTTHYPLMLLLRKLRHYDENFDTQNAIRHVQQRTAATANK